MVLEELLLLEGGRRGGRGHGCPGHVHGGRHDVADLLDLARDQLEHRVVVASAALVVDGDPARQVSRLVVAAQHQDVVGLPAHPPGHVGDLHLVRLLRRVGVKPGQSRPGVEVVRDGGDYLQPRVVQVYLAADLEHEAVVYAEQPGVDYLGLVLVVVAQLDLYLPAYELLKQLLRADQVVLVVLLQNGERVRLVLRLHVDGLRLDGRGHVHEAQLALPLRERDAAAVLDQGEVGVVYGHLEPGPLGVRACVRPGERRKGKQQQQ